MRLTLYRKYRKANYTIGELYINGEYFCNTLEDTDRDLYQGMGTDYIREHKVWGETAIPYGTYKVTLEVISPKFSKKEVYKFCEGKLPRLLSVPAFDGVLIHIGNTASDSNGCILVGQNKEKGKVINSTATFKALYARLLQDPDNIEINISK